MTPSRQLRAVRRRALVAVALVASAATPAAAQIGHSPESSPYEDLKLGQNLSLSAGYLFVRRDPAGVAPKSGPLASLRWDIPVGGPSALYLRYAVAPSQRNLLVPANPAATRVLATPSTTTHVLDGGLDILLTGRKTWKRIAPVISGGVGLVSDFAALDTGAYRFGTNFVFSYGGSVRYVSRGRVSLRVDATNYLWQYRYPDRYFVKASDSTAILTNTRQRSAYRGNWALSAGLTIPIFR